MDESPQPQKGPAGRRLTPERVMLLLVLAFQIAILVSLRRRPEQPVMPVSAAALPPGAPALEIEAAGADRMDDAAAPPLAPPASYQGQRRASTQEMLWPVRLTPMPFGDMAADLQRVREQMNRVWKDAMTDFERLESLMGLDDGWDALMVSPAVDMRERSDAYVLLFCLPNVDERRISVQLENRLLTVQAPMGAPPRRAVIMPRGEWVPLPQARYRFEKRIQLPGPVADPSSASAALSNNVLRVVVPKGIPDQRSAGRIRIL